jgi:hypothetical protein
MGALTLFEALFITHFVMDWIFQFSWEANNKSKSLRALLFHSGLYTLGFIPAFWSYKVNFSFFGLLFISHAVFDNRRFELWIMERFKGFRKEDLGEALWWIVFIGVDQTLHFMVLALIVLFK